MIPSKMKDLIMALIDKTISQKAIWGKTSRPNEFKLSLENGAVTTDRWSQDGDEIVDCCIYNVYGDKIDNFVAKSEEPDFDLLRELHDAAKREFYKVDETINNMFNELNDDYSVGKRQVEDEQDLAF
jgi:hypothetical protein